MRKMQLQLVSLLTAAMLATAATGQDNSFYDGPIIDMHMHASNIQIGPDGKPVAVPLRCYPGPCEGGPAAATTEDDILQMTLAAMDRHNIVLGFLSGYNGSPDSLAPNQERVQKWVEAAPGRFILVANSGFEFRLHSFAHVAGFAKSLPLWLVN